MSIASLRDEKTEDALLGSIMVSDNPGQAFGGISDLLPAPLAQWFTKREHQILAWALDAAAEGKTKADAMALMDWLKTQPGAAARDIVIGKKQPYAGYPPTSSDDTAYDELRGYIPLELGSDRMPQLRAWADRLRRLCDARSAVVILDSLKESVVTNPLELSQSVPANIAGLHQLATGGICENHTGSALHQSLDAKISTRHSDAIWGFDSMDDDSHGLSFIRGEVTVLAAPSGGGKTSLALQACAATSEHLGAGSVAVASLEMPATTLAEIMAGVLLGIPSAWIRDHDPRLTTQEKAELKALADKWSADESFFIRDAQTGPTARSLESILGWFRYRQMISGGKLQLAVIDHLHLIQRPAKAAVTDWIEQCSGMIKACASELNIPILVLAQMTKEGARAIKDSKSGKVTGTPEPVLQDLRGAAALGNDAAQVVFVHDEQAGTDRQDPTRPVRILVRKNRYGPCRGFDAMFYAKQQRFMPTLPEPSDRAKRLQSQPHDSEDRFPH